MNLSGCTVTNAVLIMAAGVATLIKRTFKPSFKPLKVVVPMSEKMLLFEAPSDHASNHLQTYLQTILQTGCAYEKFLLHQFKSGLKVV